MFQHLLAGLIALFCIVAGSNTSATLSDGDAAELIVPPLQLGARIDERSLWYVLDAGGAHVGYAFETQPLAAFPGFSGAPINLFVALDRNGDFIDVLVLQQNEPVFVSGFGPAPLNSFVRQYRGYSAGTGIEVGVPYGDNDAEISSRVYFDGVAKATASVRIVNESVLAAARKIAGEFLQGAVPEPAALPRQDIDDTYTLDELRELRLLVRQSWRNKDIDQMFAQSLWARDDDIARSDPDGLYLELWFADLSIPSVARSLLQAQTLSELESGIRDGHRPLLLLARGRHRLVDEDFVPHTAPDRIEIRQGEFPAAARDAYIDVHLKPELPSFEQAMILQADTRLGFDPSRPYTLGLRVVREHGMFRPERGSRDLLVEMGPNTDYFQAPPPPPLPIWQSAIVERVWDLAALVAIVGTLAYLLARRRDALAGWRHYANFRMAFLVLTIGFVGYWAQGQLSIVTGIGLVRGLIDGGSLLFLLYDPFSLLLWLMVLGSLFFWGRAFFCGWLCPYGAMQELAARLGHAIGLTPRQLPERVDKGLKFVKYAILGVLALATLAASGLVDRLVEVEPFKTAITTGFWREWPFVVYATLWLVVGLVLFKPFCRYVCPLGALLALGDRLRRQPWIPRRQACGSPCQLCKVRCQYQAIEADGRIDYAECFQCLDCVTIHNDIEQCVPLVLAAKGRSLNPLPAGPPAARR